MSKHSRQAYMMEQMQALLSIFGPGVLGAVELLLGHISRSTPRSCCERSEMQSLKLEKPGVYSDFSAAQETRTTSSSVL